MSTTERGNLFRDHVSSLLGAAGFESVSEVREDFKKIDIRSIWTKYIFGQRIKFGIETKDYKGTLGLDEATDFVTHYGTLVENRKLDRAWLVSKGNISPDGRALIEQASHRGLACYTLAEFKRAIFNVEPYLHAIISQFIDSNISQFYIPPKDMDGNDIHDQIVKWLRDPNSHPIAIIGDYGQGKSTFALYLAGTMAEAAAASPTKRIPILVPLSELTDEQSIEGLIGKVLASQYRVENYHFALFSSLNKDGQFLIIFDGFDEMKHGMTFRAFEQNIIELLRLDRGRAKLIILGRPTAFHDEYEFRAIIKGRTVTSLGHEVASLERRPFKEILLRGFTLPEARVYTTEYFPYCAKASAELSSTIIPKGWIDGRLKVLLSGKFDHLITKPVHARMLCEIAAEFEYNINTVSKYDLYDRFIHLLFLREVRKKGRNPKISIDVRRKFNAIVAWWLWEKGGIPTTTLRDIPDELFKQATQGIKIDIDDEGIRRDLVSGCFVEKGRELVLYSHRSIQEFFVAEHIFNTDLLTSLKTQRPGEWLDKLLAILNPEIIDFIMMRVELDNLKKEVTARRWLSYFENGILITVQLATIRLFVELNRLIENLSIDYSYSKPSLLLVAYLGKNDMQLPICRSEATELLLGCLNDKSKARRPSFAISLFILLYNAYLEKNEDMLAITLASWLPCKSLIGIIEDVTARRRDFRIVAQNEEPILWSFLKCCRRVSGRERLVEVDISRAAFVMYRAFGIRIVDETIEKMLSTTSVVRRCALKKIYESLVRLQVPESEVCTERVIG